MATKVGTLIKEARTGAGLTQEKLAKKVGGKITADDISKAERGEKNLTQATLKKIAIVTGVTQASLLNAAKGKSTTNKTSDKAKNKTPKIPSNAGISMRVTATEKKMIQYYRLADSQTKKAAIKVLKGENTNILSTILGEVQKPSSTTGDTVADMLGDVLGTILGDK